MSLTLDNNLCNIMRIYNIFQKFKNNFLLSKCINNFKENCFTINYDIINTIKKIKKSLYIVKFKEQYNYDKFLNKVRLKKYILQFKNNFYNQNTNSIKILFDYFTMFNNINLDIYLTKIQTKKLIKLFLWINNIDYKNFDIVLEEDKYYFKEIINLMCYDNKLQNYILSYYKKPHDIIKDDENPIFLYLSEMNKFNDNKTTLCICGELMEIKESENCYIGDNTTVLCDFTGKSINSNNILHCPHKSHIEHPFGFDISLEYINEYFNDLIKRKLEKNLYFKKIKFEKKINNNSHLRIDSYRYLEIKKKYDKLCEELIENSIIYYKTNTKDFNDLSLYYIKYRLNLLIRLFNIKRILSTKNNWYELCKNKYEEMNKYCTNDLINLIDKLKPYPNMFENIKEKTTIIKTYRDLFEDLKNKIIFNINELDTLNLISYDICFKDYFFQSNVTIAKLDINIYKYYEAIEVLENCSTNDNIIEFIECNSNDEICIICQENNNEKKIVKINKCGHMFHNDCLIEWLTRTNSCPICRTTNEQL